MEAHEYDQGMKVSFAWAGHTVRKVDPLALRAEDDRPLRAEDDRRPKPLSRALRMERL
jgi:hypothetical protein